VIRADTGLFHPDQLDSFLVGVVLRSAGQIKRKPAIKSDDTREMPPVMAKIVEKFAEFVATTEKDWRNKTTAWRNRTQLYFSNILSALRPVDLGETG